MHYVMQFALATRTIAITGTVQLNFDGAAPPAGLAYPSGSDLSEPGRRRRGIVLMGWIDLAR
jgi:hypothetical protein